MSNRAASVAKALIESFAISSPEEIDVEAVCIDLGLQVVYKRLESCGATLVGADKLGLATVHACGNRSRERFSAAHELGHWLLHRGRTYQCSMHDADVNLAKGKYAEVEADIFAMHFLMPERIFSSCLQQKSRPNFKQVKALSRRFGATLAATLLRMVEVSTVPVIAASYHRNRLRWSVSSSSVPSSWRLKSVLSERTFTHGLIYDGKVCQELEVSPAGTWFEDEESESYFVWEQCSAAAAGQAFVLLYPEPAMLESKTPRRSLTRSLACAR